MEQRVRTRLALGVVLILLGAWFLVVQFVPVLQDWFRWPTFVIAAGLVLLLIGLVARAPGMAVPACIVAGVGGILYYQDRTQDWAGWSWAWTLIPAFVGVGLLLMAALGEKRPWALVQDGLRLIGIGAVLFVVFAAIFGGFPWLQTYWPVALIGLGVYLLLRPLFLRDRRMKP